MDFCPDIRAKLFQKTMFFIIIFTYLMQIYMSKMALEYSVVPCLKSMELADQVLHGHFELVDLHQVRKMIMKMLLLEIIWL